MYESTYMAQLSTVELNFVLTTRNDVNIFMEVEKSITLAGII